MPADPSGKTSAGDDTPMIVVHRDLPGEHDVENVNCWCRPRVYDPSNPADVAEMMARADQPERPD